MKDLLSVAELLNENCNFLIPLYQRNFAWTDKEISQLIIDILDSKNADKPEYYIGTLVIWEKENKYDIIDGQQRFTALLLICFALQNEYQDQVKREITKLNLTFSAREKSNIAMNVLLENQINQNIKLKEEKGEIYKGYNNTKAALEEQLCKEEYSDISPYDFYYYLLNKVKIFINKMPKKTNVKLYFERFNSRGEQLEFHEILKATLMKQLEEKSCEKRDIQKFAKIWDACSDFETPCIRFFKKTTQRAHFYNNSIKERERIFTPNQRGENTWDYNCELKENFYYHVKINNEYKLPLLSKPNIEEKNYEDEIPDEEDRYRCIINFNTFLLYVLYLTDGVDPDKIQLDDKLLLTKFAVKTRSMDWILRFSRNLLQCKFIFDNFIIRNSQITNTRLTEDKWFLHKAYLIAARKNNGPYYFQTRFDKNSFENKNNEILMLQSMFAVTFSAYKDTKWLYSIIKYLFENAKNLNNSEFGNDFFRFLEKLAKERYETSMNGKNVEKSMLKYSSNPRVPIYIFNLIDYIIWKEKDYFIKKYSSVAFDDFDFKYRRSIEHWYPQNPDESTGMVKMERELLHTFGNLCIITASQNSRFGRLDPKAKRDQWEKKLNTQSLKLQMMAQMTKEWDSWGEKDREKIENFESELIKCMSNFINS